MDEEKKGEEDTRLQRYKKWLEKKKGELNPPPPRIPGLQPFQEESTPDDLSNLILVYLAVEEGRVTYNPNMGYLASIFLGYLTPWRAFTAFLHFFASGQHLAVNYFVADKLETLYKMWNTVFQKRFPALQKKLVSMGVEPQSYVKDWLQTAFLSIDFPPELRLRVFDRVVKFKTAALLSFGLTVVHGVSMGLVNAGDGTAALKLLKDPSNSQFFQNVPQVIKKLNALWINKSAFEGLLTAVGVTRQDIP
jgi:hypothetical protein